MENDNAEPIQILQNIRIEIQNTQDAMEVDTDTVNANEGEEGEIIDTDLSPQDDVYIPVPRPNETSLSTNALDPLELDPIKLRHRAERFGIQSNEPSNFTEEQLHALHRSLGMTEGQDEIRYDVIHMHYIKGMTSNDLLEYYGKYTPKAVEWITNESCNLLFDEELTAAKALCYLSKPVKGMPVCDSDTFCIDDDGKSILLKNKDRDVQMDDDNLIEEIDDEDSIDISEISVAIPPGYWRKAITHVKATNILMRYAYKTDKEPYKIGKLVKTEDLMAKGLVSKSKRTKIHSIFERNKHLVEDSKNPWGHLAENWNADIRYAEKEYVPKLPIVKERENKLKQLSDLPNRLGFRRAHVVDTEEDKGPEKPIKVSKIKVPRMKMYADEEEEKIKRKRQLQALKAKEAQKQDVRKEELINNDLRAQLRSKSSANAIRVSSNDDEVDDINESDLALKLKNRKIRPEMDTRDILIARRRRPAQPNVEILPDYSTLNDRYAYRVYKNEQYLRTLEAATYRLQEEYALRNKQLRYAKEVPIDGIYIEDDDDAAAYRSSERTDYRMAERKPVERQVIETTRQDARVMLDTRNKEYEKPRRKSVEEHKRDRNKLGTMHADRYIKPRQRSSRRNRQHTDVEEDYRRSTSSRVAVVIKKPKIHAVASTVWSRTKQEKERLRTVSEGKLRIRRDSTSSHTSTESNSSSSSQSSSSSSKSSGSSSESSSGSSDDSDSSGSDDENVAPPKSIKRPGFQVNASANSTTEVKDPGRKSPLRIEISNDHFKK